MSRLYIRAKGRHYRTEVTRLADYEAIAEIKYNFTGGNTAVGSFVLEAQVDRNTNAVVYQLWFDGRLTPGSTLLGEWVVYPEDSQNPVEVK